MWRYENEKIYSLSYGDFPSPYILALINLL
jgi:hypothetical protein